MSGRVLVYGSCVARDTYEHVKDRWPLAAYVARQSLISAFSAPSSAVPPRELESAFQQRQLMGDLRSTLLPTLRQHARSTSTVLVDLVDERGGVHHLDDGSWVTNTAELRRSGLLGAVGHSRLVALGEDRHLELWRRALERLVVQLDRYGLRERTVVIEAPFASRTVEGDVLPPFGGLPSDRWNALYDDYYAHVRAAGLRTVRIPDRHAVSTRAHRWQPDPYHYVDEAYRSLLPELGLGT